MTLQPGAPRHHRYKESDSPRIAAKVRELEIAREAQAESASFQRFVAIVEALRGRL